MALEFLPLGGVNPKEVAEYLSAVNVGVKGIIPGEQTEKHIQAQLLQCKFWVSFAIQAQLQCKLWVSLSVASVRLSVPCVFL